MRTYLLPEKGNFYKANLHCHTVLSDGCKTPEEVKELYKKLGYSIVAYTEHDVLLPHNDLTDETFLALNAFEVEITEEKIRAGKLVNIRERKTCHICSIALEPDNLVQPCYHRTKYNCENSKRYRHLVQIDENEPDFERTHDSECVNRFIKTAREKGFFVTYNHPTWSQEDYSDYIHYEGMHAMEMFNGNSFAIGFEEYNPRVYDDILRSGKKIYCIGGDDNHNKQPDDSRYSDSGWAFTVVKAEKLNYRTVTKALEDGHFYASEGPEIYELYIEDNRVYVKCSAADKVHCTYGTRTHGVVWSEHGIPVTEVSFPIAPELGYFRITVTDERGKHACTNAYFPEEYI